MELRMDNRTALITGGSLGLGRAMAQRFAESGARVAIVARRLEVLEEAAAAIRQTVPDATVHPLACDVRDPAALQQTFAAAEKALGPVDVLVNNAGTSQTGAFESITDEIWMGDLELKLMAAVRLARLAFPGMKARKWGRIINVLNTAAKAPAGGSAPTAVSRAAGMALTKILSKEGAPHNVLVNALCTGLLESDQHLQRFKREGGGKTWEEWKVDMGKRVPLGRIGDALEFANIACFLASDAGSFISGTAINVDGGMAPVV